MTERSEVLERLEAVFADVLGEEVRLSEATTADDVEGWDSVKTVEILVAIERELGVRFNVGEIAALENVGQLVDRLVGTART